MNKPVARPADLLHWTDAAHTAGYKVANYTQQLGLGEKQLRDCCKARFHRTPKEYLEALRVRRAARALKHGNTSAVVASEFGYADTSQLDEALRHQLGTNPSPPVVRLPAKWRVATPPPVDPALPAVEIDDVFVQPGQFDSAADAANEDRDSRKSSSASSRPWPARSSRTSNPFGVSPPA